MYIIPEITCARPSWISSWWIKKIRAIKFTRYDMRKTIINLTKTIFVLFLNLKVNLEFRKYETIIPNEYPKILLIIGGNLKKYMHKNIMEKPKKVLKKPIIK